MWKYPYVQSPKRLADFLQRLPSIGVPDVLNTATLRRHGFDNSNDRGIVGVARFIGLIDAEGVPTERWSELRGDFGPALAEAIRQGYPDLFRQYPDAHRQDEDALRAFFGASTTAGAAAVAKTVGTFRTLCGLAEFRDGKAGAEVEKHTVSKSETAPVSMRFSDEPRLSLSLQVTFPAEADEATFRAFFRALREELLDRKS